MKHVVITGAASGIGWALARRYWQDGTHVHLVDRDGPLLAQRSAELAERVSRYEVDLLDKNACQAFANQLLKSGTPLYRLINNAGITHRSRASTTDMGVFERVMILNWQVPVRLSQMLLPLLTKGCGKIINLSSMAALMPVPGRAAYCASKSALRQHFETWRPELLARQIDLLMVYPSFVATNIAQNALGEHGQNAPHAQSTIGNQISAEAMALRIRQSDQRGRRYDLSPGFAPRVGYWLWMMFPRVYQRLSWKKFVGDWR